MFKGSCPLLFFAVVYLVRGAFSLCFSLNTTTSSKRAVEKVTVRIEFIGFAQQMDPCSTADRKRAHYKWWLITDIDLRFKQYSFYKHKTDYIQYTGRVLAVVMRIFLWKKADVVRQHKWVHLLKKKSIKIIWFFFYKTPKVHVSRWLNVRNKENKCNVQHAALQQENPSILINGSGSQFIFAFLKGK